MDGRSVWPDSFERARDGLAAIDDDKPIRLVPTTSFLLLPVTVEGEDLPPGFQFAREKARALGAVARGDARRCARHRSRSRRRRSGRRSAS